MNSGIKTLEIELRQQYAGRALRKAPLPPYRPWRGTRGKGLFQPFSLL